MRYLDEIGYRDIEQIVFFDIETAAVEPELIEGTPLATSWKYKMRHEGYTSFEEYAESFLSKAPLYAPFGKIVCISVGYVYQGNVRKKSYVGDEPTIIKSFFADLAKLKNSEKIMPKRFLAGFNVFAYDVPFVAFRAMVHKIKPDPWFDVAGMKQWNLKHIIDLSELLRGTMFASMSLLNVVTAFGLPSPKDELSGDGVTKAFYEGKIDLISTYCEKDVESTINIFKYIV